MRVPVRGVHYGRLLRVLEEYQELKRADPDFEPARPVVPAVVRQPADVAERLPLIDAPHTAEVVDAFNIAYEIVLQTLTRLFTHTDETDEQLDILADVAVGMMAAVLEPLGELVTPPSSAAAWPPPPKSHGRPGAAVDRLTTESPGSRNARLVPSSTLAAWCSQARPSASLSAPSHQGARTAPPGPAHRHEGL